MPQNVYHCSNETIKKMEQAYNHTLVSSPPGAVFRAKTDDAVITAYKSGKVMFQGHAAQKEAAKWNGIAQIGETKSANQPNEDEQTSNLAEKNHIGSDESGTGDYFGPITVAAVYIEQKQIQQLKQMGIQDSKKITDRNVLELAKAIATKGIPYSLLIMHNKKYNSLQKAGWSQGKMKAMLHHHAIQLLLKKIESAPYEGIVIDQFCTPIVYKNYLASENEKLLNHTLFKTKAESYSIAVAAASVIARASFLKEMDKLSNQLGFPLLKGAGNKVDQLAAKIIRLKGEEVLYEYAKVHFANTNKAMQYSNNW
ncbi:ribonuclease HIII [Virgibacillus sp. W0430]|uniref:ribonuclease HIII n=1 Tax=Virgibacillus sp. W0430 TaxID=3391580 RepID=UPI003F45A51B